MNKGIFTLLFVSGLVLLYAGAALASHYPLEAVPFIAAKDKKLLKQQKILGTKQLLNALLTSKVRKKMARQTGIDKEALKGYAHLCDLLRVRGVGPKMARLIILAGVTGIKELRKQKAADLLAGMKEANKVHTISEILPQVETIQDWIGQAAELEILVR